MLNGISPQPKNMKIKLRAIIVLKTYVIGVCKSVACWYHAPLKFRGAALDEGKV